MAVLLVALFPILLMVNSLAAWLGISVGILLLYYDRRVQAPPQGSRRGSRSRAKAAPRPRLQALRSLAD